MGKFDFMQLIGYLENIAKDDRITVWHLGLVLAIMQNIAKEQSNPVAISRRNMMELSRINSIATYHKCIRQLIEFGYITYQPSYHPGIRTMAMLHL